MMKPIALFVRVLLLFTTVAFAERVIFAVHNQELTASLSLWETVVTLGAGIRFDLAVASMLSFLSYLPAYLLNRATRYPLTTVLRRVAYFAVTVLVVIQGADLLYFDETGRHLGYEIKEAYNSGGELFTSAITAYTRTVIEQLALLAASWLGVNLALRKEPAQPHLVTSSMRWYWRLVPEGQLLLALVASAILTRGGLQSVPLEPLHAQMIGDSQRAALVLNGAYNAIFSAATPYSIERVLQATPTTEQLALAESMYADSPAAALKPVSQPNVVMVFLESWSARFMASYGYDQVTTPFFDELRGRSFTTREMLAGGHRTTEGLFSTLCSTQNPLGATVAQSQLQNYRYECLPKLLRKQGYHTAFFQGTVSGTSGTGAFAQLLGFEESFGKEHVAHHQLPYNNWGLHDPDLYTFVLEKLGTLPKPFLVGINSNSTHDRLLPPGAPAPFDATTPEGRYANVLHFADGALRDFISKLTATYPDAIVVLFADHAGPGGGGPAINSYRIPFLILAPERLAPKTLDGVATQRDIAPTLMSLLGLQPPAWFTGHSLLKPHVLQADYYHAGLLGWIEGERGVEVPVRQPSAARCFSARRSFETIPCDPGAHEEGNRGMALTTVLQDLLFQGRTTQFNASHTAKN